MRSSRARRTHAVSAVVAALGLALPLVATWYLRRTETDSRLFGGGWFHLLLVLSTIAIAALGVYTMASALGIFTVR